MSSTVKLAGDLACTNCGRNLDGYTAIGEEANPDDGDFSICIYCGAYAIYVSHPLLGLTLRPATVFDARPGSGCAAVAECTWCGHQA